MGERVPWDMLKRPDAVVRALKEMGEPADARRVAEVLADHGRRDSVRLVRFALEHLERQGRVRGGVNLDVPPSSPNRSGLVADRSEPVLYEVPQWG